MDRAYDRRCCLNRLLGSSSPSPTPSCSHLPLAWFLLCILVPLALGHVYDLSMARTTKLITSQTRAMDLVGLCLPLNRAIFTHEADDRAVVPCANPGAASGVLETIPCKVARRTVKRGPSLGNYCCASQLMALKYSCYTGFGACKIHSLKLSSCFCTIHYVKMLLSRIPSWCLFPFLH